MSGINVNQGQVSGLQGAMSLEGIDTQNKNLSIGDLNMVVMLERSNILDKQIRDQIGTVHKKNQQMKSLNEIQSKLMNSKTNTTAVSENTWSVNHEADPKEIALDNGYKVQIHGESEKWTILDANGNKTDIWGDPHVSEGDRDGEKNWDFQNDATFVFPDGTKITCICKDVKQEGGNYVYSDELVITKGNQSLTVTGLANNEPQIGEPALDGAKLDIDTNDGHIFTMGDEADDWMHKGQEIGGDWRNLTAGIGDIENENTLAGDSSSMLDNVLTKDEQNLLKELGITVYDASGVGMLTPEEINNLSTQIKSSKETLTSMSQLDMVQLQSMTGKYEQTNSMASQVMKQMYSQAKEIIRNI